LVGTLLSINDQMAHWISPALYLRLAWLQYAVLKFWLKTQFTR